MTFESEMAACIVHDTNEPLDLKFGYIEGTLRYEIKC